VNRRDFITLLGGAVAWPLAARAQQRKPMRRVGALMPYAANDPHMQIRNAAFLQGMQRLGWTVGDNIQIARHRSRDRCAHQYRSPHLRAAVGREVPADAMQAAADIVRRCCRMAFLQAGNIGVEVFQLESKLVVIDPFRAPSELRAFEICHLTWRRRCFRCS